MSRFMLLVVVVLLIKLQPLYIILASSSIIIDDSHNQNAIFYQINGRRYHLQQQQHQQQNQISQTPQIASKNNGESNSSQDEMQAASSQPAAMTPIWTRSRIPMDSRKSARSGRDGISTLSSPLDSSLTATSNNNYLAIVRDNRVDDELFYDNQHAITTTATATPPTTTTTRQPFKEYTSFIGGADEDKQINSDNSIDEPETFINNHQSSSLYLPDSQTLPAANSAGSSPSSASPTSGYNSRHYTSSSGSGYQQLSPQLALKNHHQHYSYHPTHNSYHHLQNQYYSKYPTNMFANNHNLNYIHSFLAPNKPSSSSSASMLSMPNLLNSNPNSLTLGNYGGGGGVGGFASAYISASSALSAAVNNYQLSIAQKQQQQQQQQSMGGNQQTANANSIVDLPAPAEQPSSQIVNASVGDLPGSSVCGRQQVPVREARVVGGNNTYEGEFPWAVSIQRHGNHHCGGVIVGKRWILTAAHCVRSQLVSNLVVRTGGHTLSRSTNSLNSHMEKDYQVEQIVMHDDFSRYDNLTISQLKSSANTNNADIALLKLKYDIHWTELAWPVCFPNKEAGNFSGHDATVIGWGKLNEKSEEFSNELQKVKLTIIDNKVCQNWFRQAGRDMPIDDRIICAGFKSGGKDACHGDSGGPLLIRINGQYVVVGVVSTGIGCARPLLPGLYSRVSSYINWIERYITN